MAMYDNLLATVPTDLWICGKWRKSSDGGRFDVIDPATENKVASVASATVEDAKAALDAASAAFPAWAAKKPRERGEILRKSYELIMRDAERLAKLITIENGKALSDSRGEVAYAAEFFRLDAAEALRNIGQNSVAPSSGARIFVQHKPAGVAVLVTPWEFPSALATRKIGPAPAERRPHFRPAQAGVCGGSRHAVEFSCGDGHPQDRTGARRRLPGRAQTRFRYAAHYAGPDADPGRGRRAGRRGQCHSVALVGK